MAVLCATLVAAPGTGTGAASAAAPANTAAAPANAAGESYFVIPIAGEIGVETTADMFKKAVLGARTKKATHVVLQIDSGGGLVKDEREICQEIQKVAASGIQFVAVVKKAYSAAAIIAMACRTIVMAPDGSIGATPPMRVTPDGTPQLIDEKMRSAIEAGDRAIAETAGHNGLLVAGMHELDVELSLVPQGAGRWAVTDKPGAPGAKVLKRRGTIMTLTAAEAYDAGLSSATVSSIDEVAALLGTTGWRSAGDMTLVMKRQGEKNRAAAEQAEIMEQAKPVIEKIERDLQVLDLKIKTAQNRLAEWQTAYKKSAGYPQYRQQAQNNIDEWQKALAILVSDYKKLDQKKRDLQAGRIPK